MEYRLLCQVDLICPSTRDVLLMLLICFLTKKVSTITTKSITFSRLKDKTHIKPKTVTSMMLFKVQALCFKNENDGRIEFSSLVH